MAIVGNDACWSQIVRDQEPIFNTRVACDLAVSIVFDLYLNCNVLTIVLATSLSRLINCLG